MTFWILAVLLALVPTAFVGLAIMRGRVGEEPPEAYDLQVYRDQLKEVDRDLARGVIGEADAGRIRTEISRRILTADAQLQASGDAGTQPKQAGIVMVALVATVLVAGSAWIYSSLGEPGRTDLPLKHRISLAKERHDSRPSQAEHMATLPPVPLRTPDTEKLTDLITKLRKAVASRPDDLDGLKLLARNEANLGNYSAGYKAQANVIRLTGNEATTWDYTIYADLMINAAQGYVSPEAEAAIKKAMLLDGSNQLARYYWGFMMIQADRPDLAFGIWEELLGSSNPDAPWIPPIRSRIEDLAWLAGVDYRLPTARPVAPVLDGPTSEDIENAADMNAQDRQEMIRNMVEQLNERLASDGGTPAEWARLIGALGVLGETDRAKVIWEEAQKVFAGKDADLDEVRGGARRAGLEP